MPAETSFVKAKYALAADEVKAFPGEVSEPGAKSFDKFLEEHTLTIKSYATGATLKSGELASQTKAGETFTLPVATVANQFIGALCFAANCKITTSGGAFFAGQFITIAAKVATITLTESQTVWLYADGERWWIVAGEPKREQAYGAQVERAVGVEFEPSATRPTFVVLEGNKVAVGEASLTLRPTVGGVALAKSEVAKAAAGATTAAWFICQPGQKWKAEGVNLELLRSQYLTL